MDNDRNIKFDSDRSPLEEQFCVFKIFEMSAVFKIFEMSAVFKMAAKTRHKNGR